MVKLPEGEGVQRKGFEGFGSMIGLVILWRGDDWDPPG